MNKLCVALGVTLVFLVACIAPRPTPSVSPLSPLMTPVAMAPKTPTPAPTPACGSLSNCSFEEPYICPHDATCTAVGWNYWYASPPPCWAGEPGCYILCPINCMKTPDQCFDPKNTDPKKCICDRSLGSGCWWQQPEFARTSLQFPKRVHTGISAQKVFGWGRMIEGGLSRKIPVVPGSDYEFSIYAQAWMCYTCTNTLTDWPKDFHLRIGLDPMGGSSVTSTAIIWSQEINSWDAYSKMFVTARAISSTMTLWTYARADWGNDHLAISNDVYLDDASFRTVEFVYLPVVTK